MIKNPLQPDKRNGTGANEKKLYARGLVQREINTLDNRDERAAQDNPELASSAATLKAARRDISTWYFTYRIGLLPLTHLEGHYADIARYFVGSDIKSEGVTPNVTTYDTSEECFEALVSNIENMINPIIDSVFGVLPPPSSRPTQATLPSGAISKGRGRP